MASKNMVIFLGHDLSQAEFQDDQRRLDRLEQGMSFLRGKAIPVINSIPAACAVVIDADELDLGALEVELQERGIGTLSASATEGSIRAAN